MTTYERQGRLSQLISMVAKGLGVALSFTSAQSSDALHKRTITQLPSGYGFIVTDSEGNRFMIKLLEGEI